MLLQIPETLQSLDSFFAAPGLSAEERYRQSYLTLCCLIITPVLAVYAVVDLVKGRLSEALVTSALVLALVIIITLMPHWPRIRGLSRIIVSLAASVLVYAMATGESFAFLWSYTLPLVVFFLLGKTEGAIWVLVSWAALLVFFSGNFASPAYANAVAMRFMTTYGVISVLAYGLEASRQRYYDEMVAEKIRLEDALAHVKILRGLLPICASCKSVRDDQGYWNQIETYVQQHSEAKFSHATCPQCQAAASAALPRGDHVSA